MTWRTPTVIAAALSAGLVLAACGGGNGDTSGASGYASSPAAAPSADNGAGGSAVAIAADPTGELAFADTQVIATSGTDTIRFENESPIPHNVEIEDEAGAEVAATETISGSSTSTAADLEPGTYTFYCSVPGHREAGMEGTLTVE